MSASVAKKLVSKSYVMQSYQLIFYKIGANFPIYNTKDCDNYKILQLDLMIFIYIICLNSKLTELWD